MRLAGLNIEAGIFLGCRQIIEAYVSNTEWSADDEVW